MPAPPMYFASVPTGLEFLAIEELRERIAPQHIEERRGKVVFATEAPFSNLRELRSVFRIFAYVGRVNGVPLTEGGPQYLKSIMRNFDWSSAVAQWRAAHPEAPDPPRFRAAVQRSGEHAYNSVDAAGAIGAGVQQIFGWAVNLNEPDLEVFGQLIEDELMLGITLTPSSLHYRHGLHRGSTGLKGPIAHALARLVMPATGETIVDPMCGVATISIEAALLEPHARHLAGDMDPGQIERARYNVERTGAPVELREWDARALPLERESVDAIVTDLPFGRRVGSHMKNRHLYPKVTREIARVIRTGGRAVLLTLERRLMVQQINHDRRLRLATTYRVHYGGLDPSVYVLKRV